MTSPPIGAYIRPVGREYTYALRVLKVLPEDNEGPEQWQCERWGLKDGKPFNDGARSGIHYLDGLKEVLPGVWKDEWEFDTPRWRCVPLYYKRIDAHSGQKELF